VAYACGLYISQTHDINVRSVGLVSYPKISSQLVYTRVMFTVEISVCVIMKYTAYKEIRGRKLTSIQFDKSVVQAIHQLEMLKG